MFYKNKAFPAFIARTKGVLYGDFELKDGSKSNVFIDFGAIGSIQDWTTIGDFFADFIVANNLYDVDVIFGPSYKGIMISLATSVSLYRNHDIFANVSFDRKEEKDHGEKGMFLGYDLNKARTAMIIDDVFTTGKTKYDTLESLSQFKNLKVISVVVGVDRQDGTHLKDFESKTGIKVFSLATLDEISNVKPLMKLF
jgi:orotate phosphoribosyltransferase